MWRYISLGYGVRMVMARVGPSRSRAADDHRSRQDVMGLLSRAVNDRAAMSDLRAVLASLSSERVELSRLDDRDVLNVLADRIVRGEVAFAPAAAGGPAAKTAVGKPYEHGLKIPAPVQRNKKGEWTPVWKIAASPTEGELGKAPSEFSIEIKNGIPVLTPTTTGPEAAQELITTLEEIDKDVATTEKEQADAEKVLEKNEKKLAEAQKEKKAAQKRLDAATTEEERNEAQFDLSNTEEMIKGHELHIEANKKYIQGRKKKVQDLNAQAARGIENVRLHEQAHLNINAKSVELANALQKSLKTGPAGGGTPAGDHANRQRIIDAAADFASDADARQDEILNPIKFGSVEDDKKLADWVSETSAENYHSFLKEKFEALEQELN